MLTGLHVNAHDVETETMVMSELAIECKDVMWRDLTNGLIGPDFLIFWVFVLAFCLSYVA